VHARCGLSACTKRLHGHEKTPDVRAKKLVIELPKSHGAAKKYI
jgi:hypothetical protein